MEKKKGNFKINFSGFERALLLSFFVSLLLSFPGEALLAKKSKKAKKTKKAEKMKASWVSGQVYVLYGKGGNIGVQAGREGLLMIDDQFADAAKKIQSVVRGRKGRESATQIKEETEREGKLEDIDKNYSNRLSNLLFQIAEKQKYTEINKRDIAKDEQNEALILLKIYKAAKRSKAIEKKFVNDVGAAIFALKTK